jgi:tetrahydromethanopterin S-methyltransferase subunit F
MLSELASDRLFGLVLGTIFAGVLILNAMSY